MKKNNIKTKIIAGILSAITVCSVGSVAMTSASAAVTTDAPVSSGIGQHRQDRLRTRRQDPAQHHQQ